MNVTFEWMNGFSKFKNSQKAEIFRQGLKISQGGGRVVAPAPPQP